MPTDVTEDDQVVALATYAATRSGRIDIWFNNAGFEGRPVALDEVDDALVNEVLAVNVKGTYSGMRHAISYMPGGGVVINNASPAGTKVFSPVGAIYGASKAAVVSLTRSSAIALQPQGISVFAVAPWIVDTPMLDRLAGDRAGRQDRDRSGLRSERPIDHSSGRRHGRARPVRPGPVVQDRRRDPHRR